MTQPDDAELAATIERLRREHGHLEISAEVLIERRVFVARGSGPRLSGQRAAELSGLVRKRPVSSPGCLGGYSSPRRWLGCRAMPDNKADLSSPTGSASPGSGVSARRVVERLDEPECMKLLSTAKIGRLVYNSRYGPVALPSEYKIQEESIVFRTYRTTFTEEDLRTGIAYAE